MQADRKQKELALRYAVSRLWFPQLELEVATIEPVSDQTAPITDVDVFASAYSEFHGFQTILFDCKTRKGESPINRTLWLRGLMAQLRATHGYCILKRRDIEPDHRYSAARFGVTLLTETEFEHFARSNSRTFGSLDARLTDVNLWDRFYNIPERFERLEPVVKFSRFGFWNLEPNEALRRGLNVYATARPELDPSKAEHLALFGDFVALFAYALCSIVAEIFSGYLLPESRERLSSALLLKIYGGRDEYNFRNEVRRRLALPAASATEADVSELRLPAWDQLVQLVRHVLDAPSELSRVPLIMRELAWLNLAGEANPSTFFVRLLKTSPQAQKFAILISEYVASAVQLPPEFLTAYRSVLLKYP